MPYAANANVIDAWQTKVRSLEDVLARRGLRPDQMLQVLDQIFLYEGKLAAAATGPEADRHRQRLERYERVSGQLASGKAKPRAPATIRAREGEPTGASASLPSPPPHDDDPSGDEDGEFAARARGLIKQTPVTWDQVAGLEDTKASLVQAINLFMAKRPAHARIATLDKILFYGPPGTGKTLLASAVANLSGSTFFDVGVNKDLLSKYVGEAPKMLGAVYELARSMSPAIVFLDEVTEIASRGDKDHEVKKQLHDTFLVELDGLATKGAPSNVLTIAATNFPWDLSSPVLNRFQKRVFIPLPDAAVRAKILEIHTTGWGHKIEGNLDEFVQLTAGFSGRELESVCRNAIDVMIRENNPWVTDPGAGGGRDLQLGALKRAHFVDALRGVAPSIKEADLVKYREFANEKTIEAQ